MCQFCRNGADAFSQLGVEVTVIELRREPVEPDTDTAAATPAAAAEPEAAAPAAEPEPEPEPETPAQRRAAGLRAELRTLIADQLDTPESEQGSKAAEQLADALGITLPEATRAVRLVEVGSDLRGVILRGMAASLSRTVGDALDGLDDRVRGTVEKLLADAFGDALGRASRP